MDEYITPRPHWSVHQNNVAALGCIACRVLGYEDTPAGLHHIRKGMGMSMRNDPWHTLPLCPRHHLATAGNYGEALHAGIKAWTKKFGTESELLARVYELLPYNAPWEDDHA